MKTTVCWASLLLVLPLNSFAEESSFVAPFVGGNLGYQWADDDTYSASKPRGNIYDVHAGLRFMDNWSWQLGYQYHDSLYAEATDINVDTYLVTTSVRYDWYLNSAISLFGRLGGAYWNLDKTTPITPRIKEDGFSPLAETGFAYHYSDNLAVNLSYQYIDGIGNSKSGEYDSHAVLAGITYYFSQAEKAAPVAVATTARSVMAKLSSEDDLEAMSATINAETPVSRLNAFSFDDSQLSEESVSKLNDVATMLKSEPKKKVLVVGHTDNIGEDSYNQVLSERRARNASDILVSEGVSTDRLTVEGRGERDPIASNDTEEGRKSNRRVDIWLDAQAHDE